MNKEEEKLAVFWCELLSDVIYDRIEPELVHGFLKEISEKDVRFPDGRVDRVSLSTLKRKLKRYQEGGFDALARKKRSDRGKARNLLPEVLSTAIELKKEQPRRSHITINNFLDDLYDVRVPRSTLYRHLKQANATRLKLGISKSPVRKRWTCKHTHDMWVGDFEEGPYVLEKGEVVPTCLSAFIDCHSRYIVSARYYFRQNLDVLIDSLLRAFSVHGTPLALYVDNAKVYHSNGLKAACYRLNIKLLHRPARDPATGGIIERFFKTVQDQLEAEIRSGRMFGLNELNRAVSAWLSMSYHGTIHSEIKETPEKQRQKGLTAIRRVDMGRAAESFMEKVYRTVNKTFSDVQLNRKFYLVDPKFRGDRVEVRFDPFSQYNKVNIHSLAGEYLTTGKLHQRANGIPILPGEKQGKPKHSYTDLLIRKHEQALAEQAGNIDYRKVAQDREWPFYEFAKTISNLLERKGGLAGLTARELELLKKVYNQSRDINRRMVKKAFEQAIHKTVTYIIRELKYLIAKEDTDVS